MATKYTIDDTHAVSWPSKLKSQECGHIYNVQLDTDADNGAIIARDEFLDLDLYSEGEAEGFEGVIRKKAANGNWYVEVTKCDPVKTLYVYMEPFISEDWTNSFKKESRWYNAAGETVRAYELAVGDVFELSEAGFDGTPDVGKTVTVAKKKLKVAAA
jgi:hypothetical protein